MELSYKRLILLLDDLTFNMSFTIHIKNNKGEEFICNVDRPVFK